MKYTIGGTLAIAAALSACDIPVKKAAPVEQGLGAGAVPADSAPAPAPTVDSTTAMQPNTAATPEPAATAAKKPVKTTVTDQTQSGVTDKSGSSTLGKNVTKPRPDANQPVTAKGDVVRARWDSSQGGWVYSKLGDSTTIPTPGDTKGDTAFNQQKGDSMKVAAPLTLPATPPLQGNDTMPSKQVPSPAPSTLPEPSPAPAPTPSPAPAPMPEPTPAPAPAPQR